MRALFDVNVLIAIHDSSHVHHRRAREWFFENHTAGWASCAVTQNGFVRVISQPRYPIDITTAGAIATLARTCSNSDHEFWPASISITDATHVSLERVHGPQQVTDIYLLALAAHREGRLVTFDERIPLSAAPGATAKNLIII